MGELCIDINRWKIKNWKERSKNKADWEKSSQLITWGTNRFSIQQFYILLYCIYVFCIDLRTNSDFRFIQHKVIGFYNQVEKWLLRGKNWVFK
jgi:hypothetical protein